MKHYQISNAPGAPATGVHSRGYALCHTATEYDDHAGILLGVLDMGGPLDAPQYLPAGTTQVLHVSRNPWGEIIYPLSVGQGHVWRDA